MPVFWVLNLSFPLILTISTVEISCSAELEKSFITSGPDHFTGFLMSQHIYFKCPLNLKGQNLTPNTESINASLFCSISHAKLHIQIPIYPRIYT